MIEPRVLECRAVQYGIEVEIAAEAARVWTALTDRLGEWWLPDFHMLGESSAVDFEPWAGGRLVEENGPKGLLWYTVIRIDPPKSLTLVGHSTPEYGGPSTSVITWSLEEKGDATLVTISDALFGHVTDGTVDSMRNGWTQLFRDGLKSFVERDESASH